MKSNVLTNVLKILSVLFLSLIFCFGIIFSGLLVHEIVHMIDGDETYSLCYHFNALNGNKLFDGHASVCTVGLSESTELKAYSAQIFYDVIAVITCILAFIYLKNN